MLQIEGCLYGSTSGMAKPTALGLHVALSQNFKSLYKPSVQISGKCNSFSPDSLLGREWEEAALTNRAHNSQLITMNKCNSGQK